LVVISPHRDEIRYEVARGFQTWLRQRPQWEEATVAIEWRDLGGGTSQIMRYLAAQYQLNPEGVGIDVLYGGGTDIYLDLKQKGQLELYQLPPLLRGQIRPQLRGVDLRDSDSAWHGVTLSSLGILCNREVLDRIGLRGWSPRQWKDLGDERLCGWVSAGDLRMSGSVHMLYELILQTYGWEEGFSQLIRLGANARGFARFSDGVSRDVVLGKAALGGVLDSYGFSALTREDKDVREGRAVHNTLQFVLPKGETVLNPDSIAILKGAPQRALAQAFVEYNLSAEGGQRLWMFQPQTLPGSPRRYAICRLSVIETLYDEEAFPPALRSVQLNPFDDQQFGTLVAYNNRLASERWNLLNDLFGAWIIDPQEELSSAWRAVLQLQPSQRQQLEADLFTPPCREAEFREIAQQLRSARSQGQDTRLRAETVSRWLNEARLRYRQVHSAAQARRARA
jgi:ABC-type Fe3+ transport system substrate-binding protein